MKAHFLSYTFLIIGVLQANVSYSQRVQNPAFDKKIDNLISYKVPVLSVYQAHRDPTKFVFLDAREIEEYNVSHIPGARHIGYDNFNIEDVSDLSKDATIIVYCSIGYRSDKVGGKLQKAGFNRVFNLYGSIFEWVNRNYKIVDNHDRTTLRLHTYNEHWSKWVDNVKIEKVW